MPAERTNTENFQNSDSWNRIRQCAREKHPELSEEQIEQFIDNWKLKETAGELRDQLEIFKRKYKTDR